ncbi:hypothetical protein Geu3261_0041_005 [Komagataeibacter europaeus NBRC 3261]|uniref:Uncharacterized protein n=1 Tax=Komagataeibacter europaeus NBRC 3261 TaxID=1234669 RepID=A0A0D6PZG4_KOMEU|nr:hypothetical protein Geu3261_0041_005 [Komagataeibacter europaeus NBRC 3261]
MHGRGKDQRHGDRTGVHDQCMLQAKGKQHACGQHFINGVYWACFHNPFPGLTAPAFSRRRDSIDTKNPAFFTKGGVRRVW